MNDTPLYDENVGYGWQQIVFVVGVTLLVLVTVAQVVFQIRSWEDRVSGLLLSLVMLGFVWFIWPKRTRLTITSAEIVYREGKSETRIRIADVADAIPCAVELNRRGGGIRMRPLPGGDELLVQSYEVKLYAAPERRRYSIHSGAAMAVLLTQGGVVLFPSKAPAKAIAVLHSVLHKPA